MMIKAFARNNFTTRDFVFHAFRYALSIRTNMNLRQLIFSVFAFFVMVNSSLAEIPGLPDKTIRYGLALGALQMAVDDPKGLNPDSQSVVPVNLIMTDWLSNGRRYWVDLLFSDAAYNSSPNQIGQNVRYTSLRTLVQKNIKLLDSIKPWIGVGFEWSYTSYSSRHTKSIDGFLLDKFDDRSEFNLGLVFNLTADWELKNNWYLGMKLEQLYNLENNINARGGSAFLLYLL